LAQARAQLAASQAARRSAELDLSRASIRAPCTGRIRERRANIGDYVGPASPVAVRFATDTMEVRVPLTDSDLAAIRLPLGFAASAANPGPAARVSTVTGGRIHTWEGRLVRTEASIEARTRLVYGVVEVRDPFGANNAAPLAPGMFVSARLEGSSRETLVAAPRGALKRNEFVYVVRPDNTIDVRQVRPAQTTADEVLFREGVADGERLVVSVLSSPRQGMEVTPINAAGEGAAEPAAPSESLDIRE
jgi:RND family efflux transporter MFP subunit